MKKLLVVLMFLFASTVNANTSCLIDHIALTSQWGSPSHYSGFEFEYQVIAHRFDANGHELNYQLCADEWVGITFYPQYPKPENAVKTQLVYHNRHRHHIHIVHAPYRIPLGMPEKELWDDDWFTGLLVYDDMLVMPPLPPGIYTFSGVTLQSDTDNTLFSAKTTFEIRY